MTRIHANNFETTLNGTITNVATTITLTSVTGFPTIGSGVTCNLTIEDGSDIEIVTATARSGFDLTVTRGAESTTGLAFSSGATVSLRATADSMDRKADGAASSTDNAVVRFDSTTGKVIQNSGVIIDDSNNVSGLARLDVDNIRVDGNTISSTDANGNVTILPNGSGAVVVGGNSTGPTDLRLMEDSDNGSNYTGFKAPSSLAGNIVYELPGADGTNGYQLTTNGSGVLSWAAAGGGGGGSGDVVGPASATDNAICRFDSTTGKLIQNSSSSVDDNGNLSANSILEGYATTATAAGTTTLTVSSKQQQFFTGTTTQTVVLPVTSTLVLGQSYIIVNNSSSAVTVQSSGANTIVTMNTLSRATFTCIATSGTGTSSWDFVYSSNASNVTLPTSVGTNRFLVTGSTSNVVTAVGNTANAIPVTNGSAVISMVAFTGSGSPVMSTSPTLVTPTITKGNGTESGNAVTASGGAGIITTSSLTTAAGGTYAITWTNTAIATTSCIVLSLMGGTNTIGNVTMSATAGSGTSTLTIYNNHASSALNGTIKIGYIVI